MEKVPVLISQTLSRAAMIEKSDEDIPLLKKYKKANEYTIIELLEVLQMYLTKDILETTNEEIKRIKQHILEQCKSWIEDEIEVIEDPF